eukprot:765080-Hanusia_phi.AAC.1
MECGCVLWSCRGDWEGERGCGLRGGSWEVRGRGGDVRGGGKEHRRKMKFLGKRGTGGGAGKVHGKEDISVTLEGLYKTIRQDKYKQQEKERLEQRMTSLEQDARDLIASLIATRSEKQKRKTILAEKEMLELLHKIDQLRNGTEFAGVDWQAIDVNACDIGFKEGNNIFCLPRSLVLKSLDERAGNCVLYCRPDFKKQWQFLEDTEWNVMCIRLWGLRQAQILQGREALVESRYQVVGGSFRYKFEFSIENAIRDFKVGM